MLGIVFNLSRNEKYVELGRARRKKRDNYLERNYDKSKPVNQNAVLLGISKSTIYSYLNGNKSVSKFEKKYNDFVRKLSALTGLSNKTIQKYKKRIESYIGKDKH